MLGPRGPLWSANDARKRAREGRTDRRLAIYLNVGRSDDLLPETRELSAALRRDHVVHELSIVQGRHQWRLWRAQFNYSLRFVDAHLPQTVGAAEPGKKPASPLPTPR